MATDSPAGTVENPVKSNGFGEGKGKGKGRGFSQKSGAYLPDIHRSLPQSPDAEKGILGSILLSPGKVLDECIQQQVGEKYFHQPAHARIFTILVEMRETNRPIDLITLTQLLSDRHLLEEVGGAAAVTDLFTFVPTASNASYYLELLRENSSCAKSSAPARNTARALMRNRAMSRFSSTKPRPGSSPSATTVSKRRFPK